MADPIHINHPSDIQAAIDSGRDQVQLLPEITGYLRSVVVPKASEVRSLHRDKLEAPRFLTARVKFHDPQAFIEYFNAFKDEDSRIFYTQAGVFMAVLDYHLACAKDGEGEIPAGQRHGDHLAILELKRSPEWEAWVTSSGVPMSQQAFAEFIEDHAREIISPDATTMLRVASGLHATIGAEFRQATNQANGQIQLSFNETINGTVNGVAEEIPSQFQIGIRPFMGCDRYPVDCRLRYRIERNAGAALKLHYKALHLEPVTETALSGIIDKIRQDTEVQPALGQHDESAFKRGE
jgi:uncharacterized protein YfdQ (DUF2303 family)